MLLEEVPFNELDDGCTSDTLLERDQLRYQLVLNGIEIARGPLSELKSNQLDYRLIDVDVKNEYELRVWVPEEAQETDWMLKHYHYKVAVTPVVVEE